MNGRSFSTWRLPTLTSFLILLVTLPVGLLAEQPDYTSRLPIICSPPGVLIVDDEESLRAAIETANEAGQLPRFELTADITLNAPLPALDNPQAGTAIISGNDHILDGNHSGTVLSIGPDTDVIIERLTITHGSGSAGPGSECGGGIYSAGRLTLRQTRLEDNWARRGGGICVISQDPAKTILTLEESILTGNRAFIVGGGLFVFSSSGDIEVNINQSPFQANIAQNSGGGIYAGADAGAFIDLNVNDSTLSANRAENYNGGAIAISTYNGNIITYINRSTITANTASGAAGLFHEGSSTNGGDAQAIIFNSTISGNVSFGNGGAIGNFDFFIIPFDLAGGENMNASAVPQPPIGGAHLQLLYSTVTSNRANRGSGIWNDGWLRAMGSIIADNEPSGRDCWQPIFSWGYNLDSDGSCGLNEPTDLPKGLAGLLPLALVPPGNTATHALNPESQARDRIPIGEFGCDPTADSDQRGVPRPQPAGSLCDIGAFEAENPGSVAKNLELK